MSKTSVPDMNEMRRLQAMERFVGSMFDEWVNSCSELMALYDGLSWDEVVPLAASEIIGLREVVARFVDGNPDVFLHDWSQHATDALVSVVDGVNR